MAKKEISLAIEAVAKKDFLAWWETCTKILTKDAKLIHPRANYLQSKISEIVDWMQKNKKPVRLIVLKPRQMGSSTITSAVITHFLRSNPNTTACLLGDELDTSQNLLSMVHRYIENDLLEWGHTYTQSRGEFSNGSKIVKETANDPGAGRSMTLQALLCSEVAHYKRSGERSGEKILLAIRNCVPLNANTIIIEESTPNGASGAFFNTWQAAADFENYKKGLSGNGYVRVFAAWHNFKENQEEEDQVGELTYKEEVLTEKFQLSKSQIAWRRQVLKSKCAGDSKQFDQEYPSDPVTCFLTSGRPRFDAEGLAHLGKLSKAYLHGVLDVPTGGTLPIFRTTSHAESWLYVWEGPVLHGKYLVACDTMTGSSQTGDLNPDCHSVVVLRAGYYEKSKFIKPAIVARIRPPCRVDIDVLADLVIRISRHYGGRGGCLIVPEVNGPGLALIELLKEEGANIYQREIFNMRESKRSKALGWQTTDKTRRMIIEKLAAAIRDYNERDSGLEIWCDHIIGEMRSFVITESGRAEASPGKHDDDVMAVAIAYAALEGATAYIEPSAMRAYPKDLESLINGRQRQVLTSYT